MHHLVKDCPHIVTTVSDGDILSPKLGIFLSHLR